MKKCLYLLLITIFLGISCQKEVIPKNFVVGEEEDFKVGIENKSAENNIKFTISEVQDSRCPMDVECIWQGEAEIEIMFDSPFQETILLSTYDDLIDTVGNYSIKLLEVSPYPISNKTIKLEDYMIKLKIDSLEN